MSLHQQKQHVYKSMSVYSLQNYILVNLSAIFIDTVDSVMIKRCVEVAQHFLLYLNEILATLQMLVSQRDSRFGQRRCRRVHL